MWTWKIGVSAFIDARLCTSRKDLHLYLKNQKKVAPICRRIWVDFCLRCPSSSLSTVPLFFFVYGTPLLLCLRCPSSSLSTVPLFFFVYGAPLLLCLRCPSSSLSTVPLFFFVYGAPLLLCLRCPSSSLSTVPLFFF